MKKYFYSILSLLFLGTTAFAQEASIFIPTLTVDKPTYSQGETIKAEFEIDNNSTLRQSDVFITSSLVSKINDQNVELNIQNHQQNLYLEAKSRQKLSIDHVVNADINGPAEFVVSAFLKDGSLVGQKRNYVSITNQNTKEVIIFEESYIRVDEEGFDLQVGPTVSKKSDVSVEFRTGTLSKDITVQPKIELYNRTITSENPIKIITPPIRTLTSNTNYSLVLPADLEPKVYEGVLSFTSSDATIAPIYFKYIVEGTIGTILNVNASSLNVKKGDMVSIKIEYAGIPPVISYDGLDENIVTTELSEEEVVDFEALSKTLSEEEFMELVKEYEATQKELENSAFSQSTPENIQIAKIKVILKDSEGSIIGEGETEINLDESGSAVMDVQITKSAKGFSIESEMISQDGTILSTYKTDLPSEEELKKAYGTGVPTWITIVFSLIIVIILGAIIVLMQKKFKQYAVVLILPLLASVGSLVYLNTSDAFTVHFSPQANAGSHFKVNAILSPGPSESVSYAPGEEFTLDINASYVACSNAGFTFGLYGPSDNWSTFNLNGMENAFKEYVVVKRGFRDSFTSTVLYNIISYTGDTWGSGVVIPRFIEWWTTNGELSSQPKKEPQTINTYSRGGVITRSYTIPPKYSRVGFLDNNVIGKGGFELFKTSSWGTTQRVQKHEYSSGYSIDTSKKYYMPQEPGFHEFYFMLTNRANGNTTSNRIVSQTVCVRGAGVCPNETPPPVCSNLNGTYTMDANGIISKDGVANPTLEKKPDGTCGNKVLVCDTSHTEGDTQCVDGRTMKWTCSQSTQPPQWTQVDTGACPATASCSASPSTAYIPPGAVTYTINNVPAASGPFTFKIESLTAGTSDTGVYTHNYNSINATKINSVTFGTTTLTCPPEDVTLTCRPFPLDHNQCQSDGTVKTYSYTDRCVLSSTTGPCPSTNTGTPTATFSFRPNIANTAGTCPFILSTTNAASCSLQKISGVDPIYTGTSTTGTDLGIGRYTLSCTDSAGASKLMGSASCYSNADVRED
jgi:hypothetical protein